MSRRFTRIVIIGTILLLVVGLPALIGLAVDWYWFQSVGFQSVFLTAIGTRLLLGLGVGALVFAFLFTNLRYAQRGLVPLPMVLSFKGQAPSLDLTRLSRRLAGPASPVLALFFRLA